MRPRARTEAAEIRLRAALAHLPAHDEPRSLLADPPHADPSHADPALAGHDERAGVGRPMLTPFVRAGVFDPKRAGAAALVALAALAAAVAGVFALRARPRVTPVDRPAVIATAGVSASPSAAPRMLVVDVAGAVRRPGLQRLPAGSRVADAIAEAGGAKAPATTAGLNLARKLVDGEQIVVGVTRPASPTAPATVSGNAPRSADDPLDLNSATLAELDLLSGVGPVLAQRIIAWRDEHGGFASVDQLREIEGIGDRKFATLREQVTV